MSKIPSVVKEKSSRRVTKKCHNSTKKESNDNLTNKINHGDRYVSDGLFSGQNGSKLSIDDESSHPINASNTNNNKSERKRNINMLNDIESDEKNENDVNNCSVGCDAIVGNGKRMKVDCDGQDNNKSKMYQVSIKRKKKNEYKKKEKKEKFLTTLHLLLHINGFGFLLFFSCVSACVWGGRMDR